MSNVFNFKRFVKYLRHDLVSAWQNAGISVVVIACMPVWFFAIYELFSVVFGHGFADMSVYAGIAAYLVSFVLAIIFLPVQIYGNITDKRPGSNWLLVPASAFEKFLSMLLVLCVALPVSWLAVIALTDVLLPLTGLYNGPAVSKIFSSLDNLIAQFHSENRDFALGGPYGVYLNWCADILTFALGAIFFRKNKIVYTFLSIMGIGIAISVVAGIFFSNCGFDLNFGPEDINEDSIMRWLNICVYAVYAVEFALLDLGLFFRIKTLKH